MRSYVLKPFVLVLLCFIIVQSNGIAAIKPFLVQVFEIFGVPMDPNWASVSVYWRPERYIYIFLYRSVFNAMNSIDTGGGWNDGFFCKHRLCAECESAWKTGALFDGSICVWSLLLCFE